MVPTKKAADPEHLAYPEDAQGITRPMRQIMWRARIQADKVARGIPDDRKMEIVDALYAEKALLDAWIADLLEGGVDVR